MDQSLSTPVIVVGLLGNKCSIVDKIHDPHRKQAWYLIEITVSR